jgi:hypothetical protein
MEEHMMLVEGFVLFGCFLALAIGALITHLRVLKKAQAKINTK